MATVEGWHPSRNGPTPRPFMENDGRTDKSKERGRETGGTKGTRCRTVQADRTIWTHSDEAGTKENKRLARQRRGSGSTIVDDEIRKDAAVGIQTSQISC